MGILKKITLFTTVLFVMCLSPSQAQDKKPVQLFEQKIKAGLLYNFLKSTQWPENTNHEKKLYVCLIGDDPFDGYLQPLEGRTAQQFTINITKVENLNELHGCNLVFIHRNQSHGLARLLESLKGKPILTASDIPDFARDGGMVEFSMETDKHIHLYINKKAVDDSGLKIEERLLKLSELVS